MHKSHDYKSFAQAYAKLGIEKTYYLYYREVPALLEKYCSGKKALDFGCGTGRPTRFLKSLGFDVIGIDINPATIEEARKSDPEGKYLLLKDNNLPFTDGSFDLVFQSSVAEEIASLQDLETIFNEISRVIKPNGVAILVTPSLEGRKGEWSSFYYPETGESIKSGGQVKLLLRGTDIVFYDYVWLQDDFKQIFKKTGLDLIEICSPLATGEEPFTWYQETSLAFWDMYILKKQ